MTDAMTDRLFAFNNPDQLVYDADDDECYHDLNRKIICQCIDNINQSESREKILDALDVNLRQWYTKREGYSWYNSHLHMDTNFAYFGYWDFEAAALVYLLDLDDTILHKYLYYPKDMVAWAKANYPNQLSG